jgi:hypothetical protein
MSRRVAQWGLWGACAFALPLPFFLVETGFVPLARIAMLAGALLGLIVTEGTQGVVGVLAGLLVIQLASYATLLWWITALGSRWLWRVAPRRAAAATAALLAVSLLVAASFEIYRTPFRSRSLRANLWQVLE